MSPYLPHWFDEAWVLVVIAEHGRHRRQITYWTRAKYERQIIRLRQQGWRVLYGIHIMRKKK